MMGNRKCFSTMFFAMTVTSLICHNPASGFFNQTTVQSQEQPTLYKGWAYFFQHLIPVEIPSRTQFHVPVEEENFNRQQVKQSAIPIIGPLVPNFDQDRNMNVTVPKQMSVQEPLTIPARRFISERVGGPGSFLVSVPWPFLVNLKRIFDPPGVFFCSGSLISNSIVLLAAQCFAKMGVFGIWGVTLWIGQTNQNGPLVSEMKRKISQFAIHSAYNALNYVNDIALIKMNTPVPFSSSVGAVQLPFQGVEPDSYLVNRAVIMGWGPETPGAPSTGLKQAGVYIMKNNNLCRSTPSSGQFFTNLNICIISPSNSSYTCMADVGGPVVIDTAAMGLPPTWTQVGINSYTKDCASDGLKIRVSAFRDWIDQTVSSMLG